MLTKILLEPDNYYHVFNHAIDNEDLYRDSKDYSEFICRYHDYIVPIADTIAYCFMPNHYHFCIKIKAFDQLFRNLSKAKLELLETCIYRGMSDFLNGYVQKFNRRHFRMGSLFVGNFKRKRISSDDDLRRLVCYIHNNPVEAEFVATPELWQYSSYSDYITSNPTPKIPLLTSEIFRVFDDLSNFKFLHTQKYIIEE